MASDEPEVGSILVTGLGPVTCLGVGIDDLVDGASEVMIVRDTSRRERGKEVARRGLAELDLTQFIEAPPPGLGLAARCALTAGVLALDNAAVEPDEVDPERCGLAIASLFGEVGAESAASPDRMKGGAQAPTDGMEAVLVERLGFRGAARKFAGLLGGAQALEAGLEALRAGRGDLVLAGGVDAAEPGQLAAWQGRALPGAPFLSQAAAFLVLETQDSVERREGFAFCEVGSIVCLEATAARSVAGLAEALRTATERALDEAHAWAGDVGIVFACSSSFDPLAAEAQAKALATFSQVPITTGKRFVGETFAAAFPLEVMLAADMLNDGLMPPRLCFEGKRRGVDIWVEKEPESMMGDSALVVGCTSELVAAVVLRAL